MAAQLGQPLTSPEPGWKRYDDRDSCLIYPNGKVEYSSVSNWNGTISFFDSKNGNPKNVEAVKFRFKGTKIRIITYGGSNRATDLKISIDGMVEVFSQKSDDYVYQMLCYEKTDLTDNIHEVVIYSGTDGAYSNFILDAIDIDDTGRLFHPDEVTDIKDLDIGKRIRCHYHAPTSGQVGIFSWLGDETSDFIPPTSSATPNGDFYFICVDKDYLGRWKLIADRNIQSNISWDKLNSFGIASASGLPLTVFVKSLLYEVPDVSGDTPSITAQVAYDTNYAWKAFDGDDSTYWYTSTPDFNGGINPEPDGYWIQYDFGIGNEKAINYLSLTPVRYGGSNEHSIEKWVLKGSNDGITFNTIASGTHENNEIKEEYVFNNTIAYRYYRLYIRGYGNQGNVAGAREIKLRQYEILNISGYNMNIRLLTGGIDSSDKDNEWDQYIVNSNLNGTITPGDNNVWNWSGLYSWTNTVNTSSADRRTIRGSTAVSTSTSAYSSSVHCFRPVLLIEILKQPHNFTGNIDKNVVHKDPVTLSGTLIASDGYTVSYQVLLNDQVIYEVDNLLPAHDIDITIPSDNMVLGSNVIKLVAIDNTGDSSFYWIFNVSKVNEIPFITASMKGLTLNLRIDDPETDNVKFRIELNGNQVFPSSGYTNFITPPVLYQHIFKSSDVNIGSLNTLVIYAVDDLGSETTHQLEFIGEYSGLMFADSDGNYYSTDLGEVLKYLDFGGVIAGQTTLSVPIRLINKNGFKVTNIVLSNDNNTQPPGVRLEMSKSDLPFTPETELFYPIVLNHGDEITFYVRLATDAGTPPKSGKVTIFVKGDPIE